MFGLALNLYRTYRTYRALRPKPVSAEPRDEGASLVEYGLLVALIAVAIVGAIFGLGTQIGALFDQAAECIEATDAACNE